MVKPSEISRPITYKFTSAVAEWLERRPCVPEVVLDPLPSHAKEFKHDITAAALSLGDQY